MRASVASSLFALVIAPGVALLPPATFAATAHEHGTATLDIVVDGNRLLLDLNSPLDNLAGFEHAPRDEKQRAALKKMEASLQAAERLFKPTAAAGCKAGSVKIEQPFADKAATGAPKREEQIHTEVHVIWEFVCARPDALMRVEVMLFDIFSGITRLKVQTVAARGQGSTTLTRAKRSVSL